MNANSQFPKSQRELVIASLLKLPPSTAKSPAPRDAGGRRA